MLRDIIDVQKRKEKSYLIEIKSKLKVSSAREQKNVMAKHSFQHSVQFFNVRLPNDDRLT